MKIEVIVDRYQRCYPGTSGNPSGDYVSIAEWGRYYSGGLTFYRAKIVGYDDFLLICKGIKKMKKVLPNYFRTYLRDRGREVGYIEAHYEEVKGRLVNNPAHYKNQPVIYAEPKRLVPQIVLGASL